MAESLEPHCDPETIKSFKRTINAAILLVAARGRAPTSGSRSGLKAALVAVACLIVGKLSGLSLHDLGAL